MRYSLLLSLGLFTSSLFAQQVVNSTGKVLVSPTMSVEYSVGEISIATLFSGQLVATQGFIQPNVATCIISASIAGQDSVCAGTPTLLTATGGIDYQWFNNSTSPELLVFPNPGTDIYQVTVTDASGCSATVTKTIFGKAVPNIDIQSVAALCVGDTAHLKTTGNATNFNWNTGANINNIIVVPSQTSTYTVVGFITNDCPNTASVTVEVRTPPQAISAATNEIIACADTISLHGNTPPASGSGQWISLGSANISQSSQANTLAKDLVFGDNRFVWSVSNAPCPGPATDTLTVFYSNEMPVLYPDDTLVLKGQAVQLRLLLNDSISQLPGYDLRLKTSDLNGDWSLATNGTLSFEPSLGFTGAAQAIYEICNALCPNFCDEAIVQILLLEPKDDIGETVAITPDGDGKNETLIFDYLDQYPDNSIVIFNRWGQKVFDAKPYLNDWAGTYNNKPLPAGTYYYLLNLRGEDEFVWGNVLIVR
ncbi:MAG: gliding motility-associated C-terminal domain-containing protein [Phycisphaerae bacterium]|nr:gliding motility-associated C-terminal domain-containing protein [Saprospiraceae bacterium]